MWEDEREEWHAAVVKEGQPTESSLSLEYVSQFLRHAIPSNILTSLLTQAQRLRLTVRCMSTLQQLPAIMAQSSSGFRALRTALLLVLCYD